MASKQTNPGDAQDAVVESAEKTREVPSALVAEAKIRHEWADTEYATPQEKRQAAVEQADVSAARPDGSHAQLHAVERPRVAVADDAQVSDLREQRDEAVAELEGKNVDADVSESVADRQAERAVSTEAAEVAASSKADREDRKDAAAAASKAAK